MVTRVICRLNNFSKRVGITITENWVPTLFIKQMIFYDLLKIYRDALYDIVQYFEKKNFKNYEIAQRA